MVVSRRPRPAFLVLGRRASVSCRLAARADDQRTDVVQGSRCLGLFSLIFLSRPSSSVLFTRWSTSDLDLPQNVLRQ